MQSSDIIKLKLTDDNDAFFEYFCDISEKTFESIKNEQFIIFNFEHLFVNLKSLFNKNSLSSYIFCIYNSRSAYLIIQDTLTQKNHIILKFNLLGDTLTKSSVCTKLLQYKKQVKELNETNYELKKLNENLECQIKNYEDFFTTQDLKIKELESSNTASLISKKNVIDQQIIEVNLLKEQNSKLIKDLKNQELVIKLKNEVLAKNESNIEYYKKKADEAISAKELLLDELLQKEKKIIALENQNKFYLEKETTENIKYNNITECNKNLREINVFFTICNKLS